jgi:hypothetical protein
MSNSELCKWLRDNSAGVYRKAAEAADVIEQLEHDMSVLQDRLWWYEQYMEYVESNHAQIDEYAREAANAADSEGDT